MSYTVKQRLTIKWNRAVMFEILDFIKYWNSRKEHNWLVDYDLSISDVPGMMDVYLETRRGIPMRDICNVFGSTRASGNYGDGCSYSDGDCCCINIHFKDGEIIQIQEILTTWDDTDKNNIGPVVSLGKIYSKSEIEDFKKEHDIEVTPKLSIDELSW